MGALESPRGAEDVKKETNGEMKEGAEEARELSASNYGRDEWWVLLDPIEGGPSS